MKLKRFEILLPLSYNDGRPIERVKFTLTNRGFLEKFGGLTTDSVEIQGAWKYGTAVLHDRLVRLTIDSDRPRQALLFLRRYKDVLKTRFDQIDIWITAHDVEII